MLSGDNYRLDFTIGFETNMDKNGTRKKGKFTLFYIIKQKILMWALLIKYIIAIRILGQSSNDSASSWNLE